MFSFTNGWKAGSKALAMDVGMASPFAPIYSSNCINNAGRVPELPYNKKITENKRKCQPMVWTTLGAVSSGTEEVLATLIHQLSSHKDISLDEATHVYGCYSVSPTVDRTCRVTYDCQTWNQSPSRRTNKASCIN